MHFISFHRLFNGVLAHVIFFLNYIILLHLINSSCCVFCLFTRLHLGRSLTRASNELRITISYVALRCTALHCSCIIHCTYFLFLVNRRYIHTLFIDIVFDSFIVWARILFMICKNDLHEPHSISVVKYVVDANGNLLFIGISLRKAFLSYV